MQTRLYEFSGTTSDVGGWQVTSSHPIIGDGLVPVAGLDIQPMEGEPPSNAPARAFVLRGIRSNERYIKADERADLVRVQADLGRGDATCASLIPIRKSPAWWALAQDERRAIMEEQSHHIAIGARYLPAIARRLFHCRDLLEPFDFLTWFEFAPEHAGAFDDLLGRLRETHEWSYIDREVELRLVRPPAV